MITNGKRIRYVREEKLLSEGLIPRRSVRQKFTELSPKDLQDS